MNDIARDGFVVAPTARVDVAVVVAAGGAAAPAATAYFQSSFEPIVWFV